MTAPLSSRPSPPAAMNPSDLLKVVNPGSFAISSANVQPMYQPGIQATSDLLHLAGRGDK